MKKINYLSGLFVGALVFNSAAFAGTAAVSSANASSKVCIVEVARVLQKSDQVQNDVKKLKAKFESDKQAIEKDQATIEAKTKELKKNEAVMSDADKSKANKEISAEQEAFIKKVGDFQAKLNAEQKAMMDVVFKELNTIIQQQAKSASCDVVLDSQFVLWAANNFDITNQVQAAFEKEKSKK